MKLIILGGGALQIKNIRMSKGITAAAFANQIENGQEIFETLRRQTGRINWASALGNIQWIERPNRENIISWYTHREAA